ncbi:glycosyltransferase [Methylophaga thalassica]|uniref:glycosyltransferase n=1 Tax=Methylophaga aminisulfidivorans TaxID=230105 RepID=UPI003A93E2D2
MSAKKVRVISLLFDAPVTRMMTESFLYSWMLHSGLESKDLAFTFLVRADSPMKIGDFLAEYQYQFDINVEVVPDNYLEQYGDCWPLSFIEYDWEENTVIYSPLNVVLSNSVSHLIQEVEASHKSVVTAFPGSDSKQKDSNNQQVSSEQNSQSQVVFMWLWIIERQKIQLYRDSFRQLIQAHDLNASGIEYPILLKRLAAMFTQFMADKQYTEISSSRFSILNDYDDTETTRQSKDILFFVNDSNLMTEDIFTSAFSFERFLERTELSDSWLFFQRVLRQIYHVVHSQQDYSFHLTSRAPYYIYTKGLGFRQGSAGIRALYYLCHALNEAGAEAYLVGADIQDNSLRTPRLSLNDVERHRRLDSQPIVIYPEVVHGNPLKAPFVVRWLLNKPGFVDGDDSFNLSECIYTYTHDYVPEGMRFPQLIVPVVNSQIFHNDNNPFDNKREGKCYYANKYLAKGGQLTEEVKGARSVCQDVRMTHAELADIFRKSELLYCYEPSAIIREALLCGCPVVMLQNDLLSDNLTYPISGPGIAEAPTTEQIRRARETIHLVAEEEMVFLKFCRNTIQSFIRDTQANANKTSQVIDFSWYHHLDVLVHIDDIKSVAISPSSRMTTNGLWLKRNTLSETSVTGMAERMVSSWMQQPSFHLLLIVNPTELQALSNTIESLEQQLYQAWGLTILSNIPAPDAFSDVPENIEWVQITGASLNEDIEHAVSAAQLDWIMQLIPGDKLAPHALLSFADTVNLETNAHFIYSDEVVDESKADIWFKPEFNLDYLRAYSYLGRSFIVSREAFEQVGGYSNLAYVQTTDMAFKVYEQNQQSAFSHIPDVLLTSVPLDVNKELLAENEWLTRHAHLNRLGVSATISNPKNKPRFQTVYSTKNQPKVSIIIAHHNNVSFLARCLEELELNTTYINYEVVVVDVMSDIEDIEDVYAEMSEAWGERFVATRFDQKNYSAAINHGVNIARGDFVVVMSCFAMAVNGNWLNEMMPLMTREDVGIVGARVLDDENKIIHAGGVFGITDDVTGLFQGLDITEPGYMERAHCIQQYSSVSSACFGIEKQAFIEAGGLCENVFSDTRYSVMDLCLTIQQQGKKVIWSPYVTLFQDKKLAEQSNGVADYHPLREDVLVEKWSHLFTHDPFYNDNLSLRSHFFAPEVDIQRQWDPRFHDKTRVVVFPINGSGSGIYRMIAPMQALAERGDVELTWMPFHEFKEQPLLPTLYELIRLEPDVLYVQQMLSDVTYEFLKQVKAHTQIKIVFSLDDLVTNLPKMNDRKKLVFRDMRSRLRKTLALCNHTIVSTQPLADLCRQYTDNVTVIPNRLEKQRWLNLASSEKKTHKKPRVGWAGAHQHAGDLALMSNVVQSLADKVDWVFMGMCPPELRPYVKEFRQFVSFNQYPQALADLDLDLALAPLEEHPFNDAKSNLRLLEYGVMGWPVIASDIYPYQQDGAPVTLIPNDEAVWIETILAALAEPEKIAAQGRHLQNWVCQKFILEDHLDEWLNVFKLNKNN